MIPYLAILGGNDIACPAIQHLQDLGYQTLVLDRNQNAPARDIARRFLAVDFSDIVETEKAISQFDISGVMALNDFGVMTAAHIATERNLPGFGYQAAVNVTNKVHMKQCWEKEGLSTPHFTWAGATDIMNGEWLEWDEFPCIMKPAFSGGGSRGVYLVHNREEIRRKLEESLSVYIDEEIIFEEYIKGTEHTLEVLIFEGKTHILSISDKENYPGNVSIVQNLFFPGPIGNMYRSRLEPLISKASEALGLSDGCCHFEILIQNDRIFLLEVGGRPGGGLNFFPICTLSTGYDYPGELARVLTGDKPTLEKNPATSQLGWHYFMPPRGMLKGVIGFDMIKNHPKVIDARMYVKNGKTCPELSDDLARPGYFLIKGADVDEVRELMEELDAMVDFETEMNQYEQSIS